MGADRLGVSRYGHRPYLVAALLGSGLIGLVVAGLTLQILRSQDWLCDASPTGVVCPDGTAYVLPGLGIVVVAGTLALGAALVPLIRRLPRDRRPRLGFDLAVVAAVPMVTAGLAFVGVSIMNATLAMLGYAALLLAAGVVPLVAYAYGAKVFLAVTCALAVIAFVVAVPAVLVAPLLGGYGIVLLMAAAVTWVSRPRHQPAVEVAPAP